MKNLKKKSKKRKHIKKLIFVFINIALMFKKEIKNVETKIKDGDIYESQVCEKLLQNG